MRKANTLSIYSARHLFLDEEAAVALVEEVRWDGKPSCPRCKGVKCRRRSDRHGYFCSGCRKNFTVRHGSIFANSRLPLCKWLYAMYLMQTARKGISALQLSKELEVSYKTAWFLLHRLREACDLTATRLMGVFEVDETAIGGNESNRHESKKKKLGRGSVGKAIVAGAVERNSKTAILRVVGNTDGNTLLGFVGGIVVPGSTVYTDGHAGYKDLSDRYEHTAVIHSVKEFVNGMAHTNSVESLWAVIKRGYNGVYHHWSLKHMQRYLNEYAFRYKEGNCEVDTIDRMRMMIWGAMGRNLPYKELIRG